LHIDVFSFIKNWSQTQDTTIYEQLAGGIRYIDLRACYIVDDWYTQHFLIGTRTQLLLNDIQKFMSTSTGEIVVIELGELVPADKELSLVMMIKNTLDPYLAPKMQLNKTTIGQMVKSNHRIIVLYPKGSNYTKEFAFLWDKASYMEGSYANKDKLQDMEAWNVRQITTKGGHGKIFELSWTLTTQDSDLVKTLLDPFARHENLKQFALHADTALDAFAKDYKNYMLGNILLLDMWEYSNVVEFAIEQNLRMCNDNPEHIAVRLNGQYCRNYITNGNCTNANFEQWMSENCRLSCGYC